MAQVQGKIVQCIGAVVDVEFPRGSVPNLFNALHAEITYGALAKTLTLEVAQHLGDNLVRCISMQPTDGLVRGVDVTDTGSSITVPVGHEVKGHVFNALGHCLDKPGYGEDFDLNKVRYHKVIIMADADVDGAHIATLNLTLFFRYMRPMITAGYVYVAMPPLYRLKWTKGPHDFVYTDAERDRVLAEGKSAGRQLPKGEGIQRYKGLGEMSYQELWETTMDPDHRILKQVQIEDAAAADETFSMLMGDEVEPRRLFIQRNARNVSWIDA